MPFFSNSLLIINSSDTDNLNKHKNAKTTIKIVLFRSPKAVRKLRESMRKHKEAQLAHDSKSHVVKASENIMKDLITGYYYFIHLETFLKNFKSFIKDIFMYLFIANDE